MTRRTTAGPERPRRRGRPKGRAVLADRSQLLAAAERAIASVGTDVTMDQIAAEAAVTKPILYRTIGDRDAVIDAMSDVLVDRIVEEIAAFRSTGTAPRDAFRAAVSAYLSAVGAHRDLYLFVNAAGQRMGPLRRRIDRSSRTIIDVFEAAAGGLGTTTSPLTWSHSIIGALQIVTLMWIESDDIETDRPRRTVEDLADDFTHLLWPGVEAILAAARVDPTAGPDEPSDD